MFDQTAQVERPFSRQELEKIYGDVYDEAQLNAKFKVIGILAPFITVRDRKTDEEFCFLFQMKPRLYFAGTSTGDLRPEIEEDVQGLRPRVGNLAFRQPVSGRQPTDKSISMPSAGRGTSSAHRVGGLGSQNPSYAEPKPLKLKTLSEITNDLIEAIAAALRKQNPKLTKSQAIQATVETERGGELYRLYSSCDANLTIPELVRKDADRAVEDMVTTEVLKFASADGDISKGLEQVRLEAPHCFTLATGAPATNRK